MAQDIYYDDTNLQRLFEQLTPEQRRKSFRGAMLRAGSALKKAATTQLRSKMKAPPSPELEKGIRRVVYKKKALGFRVTVGTKRKRRNGKGSDQGFYLSRRRGKNITDARERTRQGKPALIWLEEGTAMRSTGTKGKSTNKAWEKYRKKGKKVNRGRVAPLKFMEAAKRQAMPGITDRVHNEITRSVLRTAKKYGCK